MEFSLKEMEIILKDFGLMIKEKDKDHIFMHKKIKCLLENG